MNTCVLIRRICVPLTNNLLHHRLHLLCSPRPRPSQGQFKNEINCTRPSVGLGLGPAYFSKTMDKPKVYVTRPDIPDTGLALLRERYDLTIWSKECPVPRQELLKQVEGKHGLFCLLTDKIDKELLDAAGTSLRVVGTMSVGYDHVDIPALKQRGVKLGYTPDVLTAAVAELTVGLLLATSRRIFEAHQQIIDNKWTAWAPSWMCGPGLDKSTVGIVGFGRIGQQVAARLAPFGVDRFLYTSRTDKTFEKAQRVSVKELLAQSDFIVVTCAFTPETQNMFDDEAFSLMKPSAIFVNTSRGGLVDQPALMRALDQGKILAAGLDVMTPEPLPANHPLLKYTNCVILPHIGSATTRARTDMAVLTAHNIIAALEGKPLPAEVC